MLELYLGLESGLACGWLLREGGRGMPHRRIRWGGGIGRLTWRLLMVRTMVGRAWAVDGWWLGHETKAKVTLLWMATKVVFSSLPIHIVQCVYVCYALRCFACLWKPVPRSGRVV